MRIDLPSPPGKSSYILFPRFRVRGDKSYYVINDSVFNLRGYKRLDKDTVKNYLASNSHFMNLVMDINRELTTSWFKSDEIPNTIPLINL